MIGSAVLFQSCSIRGTKLSFILGDEDLTGNDDKLTQETLDLKLACNLLPKIVFHSQAEIAGLLEVGTSFSTLRSCQILRAA